MKGNLVSLFIWFLLVQQFTFEVNSQTLKIAMGDGRPYIFEENRTIRQDLPGFSIEIVQAAFNKLGWEVEFIALPFSRQMAETEKGNMDGIMALLHSDAPTFIFPNQPVGIAKNCFYAHKYNTWRYQDIASLDQIRFGVINAYSYGPIDNYVQANNMKNIMTVSGHDKDVINRLIKLLSINRIDAFIDAESVIEYHLDQQKFTSIINVGCIATREAFLAFSPKLVHSKARALKFDQAVNELRKTGELQIILDKYQELDWQ